MKRISVLGSTGSIGRQTLDVIAAHPHAYGVAGLAAGRNVQLLIQQALDFRPELVAIADPNGYEALREGLSRTRIEVMAGPEGIAAVAAAPSAGMTLVAMVGAAGIEPTLAAIAAGKDIALANKETLVAAGSLVTTRARAAGIRIIPVDSEHSAIFQCLAGVERRELSRVILTASGGPFRTLPLSALEHVTVAQALNHPNWRMGEKISIDSATLMNKGLEVIEAHWLFAVDFGAIEVVIHPESIVHSLIELKDGAILAQLGTADMRLPIAYALSYPSRLTSPWPGLPGIAGLTLHFDAPDRERFPALSLAYEMGGRGGTWPVVMNAANEEAVHAFLRGELHFREIVGIVTEVCGKHGPEALSEPQLSEILAADSWARVKAAEAIKKVRRAAR